MTRSKSNMDSDAAARIRRARGEKDPFSKRASDAARRNDQRPKDVGDSSSKSGGSSSGSKGDQKSGGGEKK
ncbi:uncharacterized protein B0T15DRAFT_493675 [Chaetomium strumarium]|uniref:Uncharacterized protein n=1 Tax=Chaetomium strumarium TaxID=1170767 RepID=A0AAJ0GSV7_9PEZI|nr:hypothetical protein B0T15DRAFT_493675 [Chaetomium strumarium]